MNGWLVNDVLTTIPGTRTLWHHLVKGLGVTPMCAPYPMLAQMVEDKLRAGPMPDYIIRNATYFRPIRTAIPQIALIQDIAQGPLRRMQLDVARQSVCVVFNSEFTRWSYPELADRPNIIIPLGVDADTFRVLPIQDKFPEARILFVGSHDPVKGFDVLEHLISETPYNFVTVMKDYGVEHPRVKSYVRVPHSDLPLHMNSCHLGLCLSRTETQHLAGIEMGLCGIPILATSVGTYFDRPTGLWGRRIRLEDAVQELTNAMQGPFPEREHVRNYWIGAGFSIEGCTSAWKGLVERCVSL